MRPGLLFFFFFFTWRIAGQQFYFREELALTEGNVRQISILFQSTDQWIWMGTDQGLFTYDGRKYKYKPRPDQEKRRVTSIAQDPDGQIWAGYEDGHVHIINRIGLSEHFSSDSLEGSSISKILFSASSTFLTTYGKGIWQISDGKLTRIRVGLLASTDDIYDALMDGKGRLWLATDNGIWVYKPMQPEALIHINRKKGLPDEIVTQLEQDDHGDIWIGLYDHGLARYQVSIDSVISLVPADPFAGGIKALAQGHAGEVWFITEKSADRFSMLHHHHKVVLPQGLDHRPESILFDEQGILWMTMGNKVITTNTCFEQFIPGIQGIQAIGIAGHKIWLGCEKGLFAMDPLTNKVTRILPGEGINVLSLYTDPDDRLWIGTFGQGLYCFDPATGRTLHLTEKNRLSNNSILNIDGRDKTLWLATLGGITQLDWSADPFSEEVSVSVFLEKYNFSEGYVYDVYAGDDGWTWFGTDGKGLYALTAKGFSNVKIPSLPAAESDQEMKTVYSITGGPANSLWISGSQGQILQLDRSGKINYHVEGDEGQIYSLVTSGQNEILMVGEGGIQVANQWGDLIEFGESSGLKSFVPNINAVARDPDGSIWMADAGHIWHYIPPPADTTQFVRIHLEAVSPAAMNDAEGARLSPDSNFLDIRFTGLWYQDPASVRYRYMLAGHDQDWIYTREGRAVYSRLSPGNYTFNVEGAHHDDFTDAATFSRSFTVIPPFYLRWWFILGSSLLLSWITFSYVFNRIRRINKLHQLEKEKTMLRLHAIQAQVNPHFLFNSFNTLAGIIEEDQHAAVDYVDHLSSFFRGVLMHRNAELIHVEEELELVRNYAFILQKRYGTNLVIDERKQHNSGWIAPLSIQLLVENAIKHNIVSTEKPLHITIGVDKNWVTVSNPIQPKFNDSAESTGFGLSSLLARYQYLAREKVEIHKTPDTFTVKIPIIDIEPGL